MLAKTCYVWLFVLGTGLQHVLAFVHTDSKHEQRYAEEYVEVHQHTMVFRHERALRGIENVKFPQTMEFTIVYNGIRYPLTLTKHDFLSANTPITDDKGKVSHILGSVQAIYQNFDPSAIVITCKEAGPMCTLIGSVMLNGTQYGIMPMKNTESENAHTIRRRSPTPPISGTNGAIPPDGFRFNDKRTGSECEQCGPRSDGEQPVKTQICYSPSNQGPHYSLLITSTSSSSSTDEDSGSDDEEDSHNRRKRGVDGAMFGDSMTDEEMSSWDEEEETSRRKRGLSNFPNFPESLSTTSGGSETPEGEFSSTSTIGDLETSTDSSTLSSLRSSSNRIPRRCYIIEGLAIVDESVWECFLTRNEGNEEDAEAELRAFYLAMYTEADMRFCYIGRVKRRRRFCVRLYLSGIVIQKTAADSWSRPAEYVYHGDLYLLGKQALDSCRAEDGQPQPYPYDVITCFTKKDIVWDWGKNNNHYFALFRGLAYIGTICTWPGYGISIVEDCEGAGTDLVLAHVMAHLLGAYDDDSTPCTKQAQFIMAAGQLAAEHPALKLNKWWFSNCSVIAICNVLDALPPGNCLKQHSFTQEEWEEYINEPLGGEKFDALYMCKYAKRYMDSELCNPRGRPRLYPLDICTNGVYCTNSTGHCCDQCRVRVYNGAVCYDKYGFEGYCYKGECHIPCFPLDCDIDLGGLCEAHFQCVGDNVECCEDTKTCCCQECFYDDGNGNCVMKHAVCDECPGVGTCLDEEAECDVVCKCKSPEYVQVECRCVPNTPSGLCATCNTDEDCCWLGNRCLEQTPGNSICFCPMGSYLDDCGVCVFADKPIGAPCCGHDECFDANAICHTVTKTCECRECFYVFNFACVAQGGRGDDCTDDSQCKGPSLKCFAPECVCNDGYMAVGGVCVLTPGINLCSECTAAPTMCAGQNVECIQVGLSMTCGCPFNFYVDDCGLCQPDKPLGSQCMGHDECLGQTVQCNPTTCVCECNSNTAVTPTSGGLCGPRPGAGEPCFHMENTCDDTCQAGLSCHNGVCLARIGATCGPTVTACTGFPVLRCVQPDPDFAGMATRCFCNVNDGYQQVNDQCMCNPFSDLTDPICEALP